MGLNGVEGLAQLLAAQGAGAFARQLGAAGRRHLGPFELGHGRPVGPLEPGDRRRLRRGLLPGRLRRLLVGHGRPLRGEGQGGQRLLGQRHHLELTEPGLGRVEALGLRTKRGQGGRGLAEGDPLGFEPGRLLRRRRVLGPHRLALRHQLVVGPAQVVEAFEPDLDLLDPDPGRRFET